MDIVTFARLNGVLIDRLQEDGKWHRVPTETHPKKKNGAYMSRGVYGFVQDHAAHGDPVLWQPDATELGKVDREAIALQIAQAAEQIKRDQAQAAKKAGWILSQCVQGPHPYLVAKGFPEEMGLLWRDEKKGDVKLCIPMRVDGHVVGLQTISDQPGFEKRFMYGQRTSEACYVMGKHGVKVFCEGFATGLSVRDALLTMRRPFQLFICFTAGNMLKIARNHGEGIVIADHDLPSNQHLKMGGHGKAVADEIGLPFWLSNTPGDDFNDFATRVGAFRAAQALKPLVMPRRDA